MSPTINLLTRPIAYMASKGPTGSHSFCWHYLCGLVEHLLKTWSLDLCAPLYETLKPPHFQDLIQLEYQRHPPIISFNEKTVLSTFCPSGSMSHPIISYISCSRARAPEGIHDSNQSNWNQLYPTLHNGGEFRRDQKDWGPGQTKVSPFG